MENRRGRKRAVKATAIPVIDEEEPKVKRGRGRMSKKADEVVEEQAQEIKNVKGRGKKVVTDVKVEPTDEDTQVGKTTRRRGKNNTANSVKNEIDAVATKTKRGRKNVVLKKEEEEENDTQKPATSMKRVKVKKEEGEDAQEPSTSNGTGKKTKPKSKGKVNDNEEKASTTKTPGGKQNSGKGKKKSGQSGKGKENTDTSNIPQKSNQKSGMDRVVVVKGAAAVDGLCPVASHSHVYQDDDDDVWDCMLNQTNIQFNNNKYYLIQLLEDDTSRAYSVWMRWGRVGANGQNSLHPCASDLDKAMKIFTKKFSDKTKNDWEMRDCFEKVPGKYDLLFMDYSKGEDTPDAVAATEKINKQQKKLESKLAAQVCAFIELICDVRKMEEAVMEMKYDAKKAPLGKLTTEQIKAGYLALKKIDNLVQKGKTKNKDLLQACNDFYTRIPHYFGMKVPPLIYTKAEICEKMALLEALGDIQAALSVLGQPGDSSLHPADQHYSSLKCDISLLLNNSPDFKVLESYLQTTHAKTHNQYSLELVEAFTCRKENEHQRFHDVGNRQLLWHGSRMSNWAGILSTGLRIAPPEAPATGYMFGKGIYFADMASKSANYCWATKNNNEGFLLLCEVALGKSNHLYHADYSADKLPAGCNSVKACGRTVPHTLNYTNLSDGTVVPMGPGVNAKGTIAQGFSLLYNEYIVYDPAQVLTRFILKVKFNFK